MKCLILAAALLASTANAQTSGSLSITNDYVSRGTSQTYGKPAVNAYVEHQEGKIYVGAFAANVDFNDGTDLETDVFVGYRDSLGAVSIDASIGYIGYQGTKVSSFNPSGKWDMVEAKITASAPVGPVTVTGSVGYTPDYFNIFGESVWLEAGVSKSFGKVNASASFGRQFMGGGYSYSTWNIGASHDLGRGFSLDARYHDTNRHDLDSVYRPRLSVTLRKAF